MTSIRLKEELFSWSLLAAVVTIPLHNNWNSIALIVFVCSAALQRPLADSLKQLGRNKFWLIPFVYFFWTISTYFWDTSGGFTVKELERYVGLAFVPFGMAIAPVISRKQLKRACFAFSIITITICLLCLYKSLLEYQQTQDYRMFYYHYLSEQMHLNAIFLSNYCLASLFWILYFGFITRRKWSLGITLLFITGILFLILMILLLSSKMIILLALLALVFTLVYFGYRKGRLITAIIFTIAILLGGAVLVKNLSYLNYRIGVTEWKEYKGQADDQNGIAIRVFMWKTGLRLIRERPLQGYGLRGAREATLEQYKKGGFLLGYERKYHTHNQYIETTLMSGVPGLLLFLSMVVVLLWTSFRKANFLLLLGALHFAAHSLIESVFEVQQEMIFFIFFLFLFYYQPPTPASNSSTNGNNVML